MLAAAVRSQAEVIVTYNRKDFPATSLAPYAISVQGPSTFLKNLHDLAPDAVWQTLEEQAAAIGRPMSCLLERLRVNVPAFVDCILGAEKRDGGSL